MPFPWMFRIFSITPFLIGLNQGIGRDVPLATNPNGPMGNPYRIALYSWYLWVVIIHKNPIEKTRELPWVHVRSGYAQLSFDSKCLLARWDYKYLHHNNFHQYVYKYNIHHHSILAASTRDHSINPIFLGGKQANPGKIIPLIAGVMSHYPFFGDIDFECMAIFEGFLLCLCIVWVGNIMTRVRGYADFFGEQRDEHLRWLHSFTRSWLALT